MVTSRGASTSRSIREGTTATSVAFGSIVARVGGAISLLVIAAATQSALLRISPAPPKPARRASSRRCLEWRFGHEARCGRYVCDDWRGRTITLRCGDRTGLVAPATGAGGQLAATSPRTSTLGQTIAYLAVSGWDGRSAVSSVPFRSAWTRQRD